MTQKQDLALSRVLRARSRIEQARRDTEVAVARAFEAGLTAGELSRELGLTRSRVYQMRKAGRAQLDR